MQSKRLEPTAKKINFELEKRVVIASCSVILKNLIVENPHLKNTKQE